MVNFAPHLAEEVAVQVGYFSTNTALGIPPGQLARELEERGFDSLWLPQHSHIPVERAPTGSTATSSQRPTCASWTLAA